MPHRTPADTAAATQKTDKHTPVPRRTTGNRTEHTCPTQKKHCAHEKKITTGGTPQANALKKTKKNLTEKRTPHPGNTGAKSGERKATHPKQKTSREKNPAHPHHPEECAP